PTPKKKFAGGKIIATILGLFLLIGGVGAGVYLVQQNQDIREKAGGCRNDGDCDNGQTCNKQQRCVGGDNTPVGPGCGGGSGDGCEGASVGESCGGEKVCKKRENGSCSCVGSDPIPVPVPAPTVPPTKPPIKPVASCQNIKAYSPTWELLTNTQLSTLTAGSKVNFCVTGTTSVEVFDKARFTINNVVQNETTSIRPGTTDFCQGYAIPATIKTFNITAQIHHVTLGWK
ncbi:MAG: hypothetical protein Q8Q30_03435, partial [Candidatus Woesebacteria bacterium]|nr:hypothetical protein [Candidatus Woesebacteria bacterium]